MAFTCKKCHALTDCAWESHMGGSYGPCEDCRQVGPCVDCRAPMRRAPTVPLAVGRLELPAYAIVEKDGTLIYATNGPDALKRAKDVLTAGAPRVLHLIELVKKED